MLHTLNMGSIEVKGGSTAVLETTSDRAFCPERLVVPASIAASFEIGDIQVDGRSCLVSTGSWMPAIAFMEHSHGERLSAKTVPSGTKIRVLVCNPSDETKFFHCELSGPLADRSWVPGSQSTGEKGSSNMNMKRRPGKKEAVEAMAGDIEEEMRQEAAAPAFTGMSDAQTANVLLESRMSTLDDRVMMLQERIDNQEGNGRTEILSMLADLFDRQISATLIAAGCQGPVNEDTREYALGFGSTLVRGNSSSNISVQPQVVFRPERLVIPASIAEDFLITDIKVGKNSQLVSTGALPAAAFTVRSESTRMAMDTAQISMFVTVSVTNISKEPKNFQGVIFGPSLDPTWSSAPAGRFSARRSW